MQTVQAAIETAKEMVAAEGLARELLTHGECNIASQFLRLVDALQSISDQEAGPTDAATAETMRTIARMAIGEVKL